MGSPKALLNLGGRTVIENLLNEYASSVLSGVVLVLGAHSEEILPVVKKVSGISVVVNEHYEKEMFSSIQKGLSAIDRCDGVLIGLVDYPFIDRGVINRIASAFNGDNIVIPVWNGRKGHPVIIPFSLKGEVMNLPPEIHSLRDVINVHKEKISFVDAGTDKVLFDMDTKEDYERAKTLWKK